jgi:hypothetical protein
VNSQQLSRQLCIAGTSKQRQCSGKNRTLVCKHLELLNEVLLRVNSRGIIQLWGILSECVPCSCNVLCSSANVTVDIKAHLLHVGYVVLTASSVKPCSLADIYQRFAATYSLCLQGRKYCHVYGWLQTGFGLMNRFIDHFKTWVETTSNYSAIANPHNSQITRAHAKSSQCAFASRFLVTDLNNIDSSASVLTSLLPGEYPTTALTLNWLSSESESYIMTDFKSILE